MTEEQPKKQNNKRSKYRSQQRKNQSKHKNRNVTSSDQKRPNATGNRRKGNQRNSKWNRHRVSDHFMKRDFDSRKKDCDECSTSLRISLGLVGVIEAMRAKINKRIEIVTGFYCSDCRDKQYGIKRDFHHQGVAADIKVKDMSVVDLFLIAETFPEIKGLGINFDDEHVHIDTRKEDERQTWVEINNEWILITEENREKYIPTSSVNDEKPAN